MPPKARPKGPLTHQELIENIHYDPLTGIMVWIKPGPRRRLGEEIGWLSGKGYREVQIFGECWRINRFAVFYMTGEPPAVEDHVDHRNLIRDDNTWENLRQVTPGKNQLNTNRYGESRCILFRGNNTWRIRLNIDGVRVNKQIQGTFEDAVRERDLIAEARGGLNGHAT